MPGRTACLCFCLLAGACSAPAVEPDLSSSRASAQVPAIVEAAEPGRGQEADPAALVARLDDDDPAVRLFAIGGLQRLTDRRFGLPVVPGRRRAAGRRWKRGEAWLAERRPARPAR